MLPVSVKLLLKRSKCLIKWSGGVRTNFEIVERLGAFAPSFPGLLQARGAMALESAQQIFPLVSSLDAMTTSPAVIAPQPITAIYPEQTRTKNTSELGNLFVKYGSDKSTNHDYHLIYGPLLTPHRSEPLRILEIGLESGDRL